MATARELDFTNVGTKPPPPMVRTRSGRLVSGDPKQIRARARRKGRLIQEEFDHLYKPLDEWDEEELARGRPRAADGSFRGKPPKYVQREVHEEAIDRFKELVRQEMRQETAKAVRLIAQLMVDSDVDDKGKPIVPASTKLQAAQFLIEHAVGKPLQRQETNISVKLQGILAAATVNPTGGVGELAAIMGGPDDPLEAESWEEDDDLVGRVE